MHKSLKKIITAPHLLSAIRRCTLALPTDYLENLHSVMLKYAPKRLHFSSRGMNMRCCLAYLDHNENVGRAVDPKNKFQFSCVSGQWVARRVYMHQKISLGGEIYWMPL